MPCVLSCEEKYTALHSFKARDEKHVTHHSQLTLTRYDSEKYHQTEESKGAAVAVEVLIALTGSENKA